MKLMVPTLDFSYLQESNKAKIIENNSEFMQSKQDDSSNRKDKM